MFFIKTIFYVILLKTFVISWNLRDLWREEENSRLKAQIKSYPANTFFEQPLGSSVNRNNSRITETHSQPAQHFSSVYNRFEEIQKLVRPNKNENDGKFIAEINEVLPKVIDIGKIQANIVTPVKDNAKKQNESMFERYFKQIDSEEFITTYDREKDDDDDGSFENNTASVNDGIWEPSARRIFKGHRVSIKDFPLMASVLMFDKFQCAGSIIDDDLILTAASCLQLVHNNRFFRENPKFLSVRVGSSFTIGGGEKIDVMEVYFHPGYNPRSLWHNMAIMRLERWLNIKRKKRRVRKVKLDKSAAPFSGGRVTVVGWGAVSAANVMQHPFKNVLRYDELYPYHNSDCKDIYSRAYVTERNFCAGYISKGGGACNHDVGGPGIVNGRLVGVISFGSPNCGQRDAPTVFMKVGYYYRWIEEIRSQPVHTGYKRTTLWTPLTYHTRTTKRITTFKIEPIDDSEKNRAITVMTATTKHRPIRTTPVEKETTDKLKTLSRQDILELAAHDTVFFKLLMRKLREKYKDGSYLIRGHGNQPDFSFKQKSNQVDSEVYDDYDNNINTQEESLLDTIDTKTKRKQKPKTTTSISPLSDVNFSDFDETRKNNDNKTDIEQKNIKTNTKRIIPVIYDDDTNADNPTKYREKNYDNFNEDLSSVNEGSIEFNDEFSSLTSNTNAYQYQYPTLSDSKLNGDDENNIELKIENKKGKNILRQAVSPTDQESVEYYEDTDTDTKSLLSNKQKRMTTKTRRIKTTSTIEPTSYTNAIFSDYEETRKRKKDVDDTNMENKNYDLNGDINTTAKVSEINLMISDEEMKQKNTNIPTKTSDEITEIFDGKEENEKEMKSMRKSVAVNGGIVGYQKAFDTSIAKTSPFMLGASIGKINDYQINNFNEEKYIFDKFVSILMQTFTDVSKKRPYKKIDGASQNNSNGNKHVFKTDTANDEIGIINKKYQPSKNKYDFDINTDVMSTTEPCLLKPAHLVKRIKDDKHNNNPNNANKISHRSRKRISPIDEGSIEYYEDSDTYTKSLVSDKQKRKTTKTRRIKTTTTIEPTSYTSGIFSDVEETRKSNNKYKPNSKYYTYDENNDSKSSTDSKDSYV